MSFQERKKRERELKREMDKQDRRIALARRGEVDSRVSTHEITKEDHQASEQKPELIVKKEGTAIGPSTIVEIGQRQLIEPPFMYTKNGTFNSPEQKQDK